MTSTTTSAAARKVSQIVHGQPTSDGAGVRLTRIIGQPALPDLDPFLLLDEFGSDQAADYVSGFPDHPHRGFETVTYMLAGRMRHGDNKGNSGLLTAGSVQWMTAGSGIIHSEMPEQQEGLMQGFQLWVNLPAKDKMIAPRYQDIPPDRIPQVVAEGASIRVIAGEWNGTRGPVQVVQTQPTYLDVTLGSDAAFTAELPLEHNAFVYVFEGEVRIGDSKISRGELAVLTQGTSVAVDAQLQGRFLLVAGRPLKEPVVRYGPIVMNTQAEVRQAFEDLRSGDFAR